jgi:hypothetical protein
MFGSLNGQMIANRETIAAKAPGLNVPSTMLATADEVME